MFRVRLFVSSEFIPGTSEHASCYALADYSSLYDYTGLFLGSWAGGLRGSVFARFDGMCYTPRLDFLRVALRDSLVFLPPMAGGDLLR